MLREPLSSRVGTAPRLVVLEGVGHAADSQYIPALSIVKQSLGARMPVVVFVDKASLWRPRDIPRRLATIARLEALGFRFIDKERNKIEYDELIPDVVIVATNDRSHVLVTEEWIARFGLSHQPQIYIEKPLDADLDAARRLLGQIRVADPTIRAFDHYLPRLLPRAEDADGALYDAVKGRIFRHLGGTPARLTCYLLEDRSGSDPNAQMEYREKGQEEDLRRDGAIEIDGREEALVEGLILDLMPHVVAMVAQFAYPETIRVTEVRAGQYRGVNGDPNMAATIPNETFAEVRWICAAHATLEEIECVSYVGKGIRGVKALGTDYNGNAKLLELEGENGNKVRFDLRKSGVGSATGALYDRDDTLCQHPQEAWPLHVNGYVLLLQLICAGDYSSPASNALALSVEVGKRMLEVLEDMRYPMRIIRNDAKQLQTYQGGMFTSPSRPSAYLEEAREELEPLFRCPT